MRRLSCLVLLVIFSVSVSAVVAKGIAGRIDITGADINSPWVLTDPEMLEALSIGRLEDFEAGMIAVPFDDAAAQPFYELTRYMAVSSEDAIPWDTVRYYPDPNGSRGYIHYVGVLNGFSEYDNRWFRVTETGENALQHMLSRQSSGQGFINALWAWIQQFEPVLAPLTVADFSLQP